MRMSWLIFQYNYPSINIGNYKCQHVRSKAWVFGRSLVGIVGSNPAEGMEVVLCVVKYRVLRRADHP